MQRSKAQIHQIMGALWPNLTEPGNIISLKYKCISRLWRFCNDKFLSNKHIQVILHEACTAPKSELYTITLCPNMSALCLLLADPMAPFAKMVCIFNLRANLNN